MEEVKRMNDTTKKENPWMSILLACIGIILVITVTMTGSDLPDNEGAGQLNSESTAVYVLDKGHHHLTDGVKPELMPADAAYQVRSV